MVCDTVHSDYPGSCPSVFQGFPAESADHLTGAAGGPVSFQLLDVGVCVGVP